MGTVHLTNGHHGLYIRDRKADLDLTKRIPLTDELLARPILGYKGVAKEITQRTVRAALQALMDLPNFDAAVSYEVEDKEGVPHIALPHREWGEITLGSPQNIVVGFSHDSRYDNKPFYNQLEWLEEDYPDGKLGDEEFARFCEDWASADKWRSFFESRIRRQIQSTLSEAVALQCKSIDLSARAEAIETALGA